MAIYTSVEEGIFDLVPLIIDRELFEELKYKQNKKVWLYKHKGADE